jgi:hypothetical protein
MKNALQLLILVLMGALLPARAVPYTSHLDEMSNLVAQAHAATADMPKVHALLGKALADFEKPSTSVAGDYNIFIAVATHLIPLTRVSGGEELAAQMGLSLSNAFVNFVTEAHIGAAMASNRVAALSDFQRNKRPAANQVRQAYRALDLQAETSNIQLAMLSLRLAFVKIGVANKLAAKAEANPGLSPESIVGEALNHTSSKDTGSITFTDDTNYTDGALSGTYTYTRTGLNSALIELTSEQEETKVTLVFKTATSGVFTVVSVTPAGTFRDKGTFTLAD